MFKNKLIKNIKLDKPVIFDLKNIVNEIIQKKRSQKIMKVLKATITSFSNKYTPGDLKMIWVVEINSLIPQSRNAESLQFYDSTTVQYIGVNNTLEKIRNALFG